MSDMKPPPSYGDVERPQDGDMQLARLRTLLERHEISNRMVGKLRQLEDFDIVFVCDDSGSMNAKCALGGDDPYKPRQTRWEELKDTLCTVVEISTALDDDGIDVYFLNRYPPLKNVMSRSVVEEVFDSHQPGGYTPIASVLQQVLQEKGYGFRPRMEGQKKLLIVVATDGEPTDPRGGGAVDRQSVLNVLRQRPGDVYTTFAAMTDDEETMSYLDSWDALLPRFDVVDDYISERKQIHRVQGSAFPFSRGDYVCKILLGSIDPEVDAWDEHPAFDSPVLRRGSSRRGGRRGRCDLL